MSVRNKSHFTLTWTVACTLLMVSCQKKETYRLEGTVFGTLYHITYIGKDNLQQEIDDKLAEFDLSLSTFNQKSTISAFNQWGVEAFSLKKDPWMQHCVSRSLEISRLTDGAFDITVAPLVNVWGFGFEKSQTPTPQTIDSIRQFVGYTLLALKADQLCKKDARLQLDCSAIAKGYACDVVGEWLKSKGIRDFLVEIGGEMVAYGKNKQGQNWRIGINRPIDDSTSTNMEFESILQLTNKGVATSGNYRNFYVKDGKKIAHTIHPKTGYPIQQNILSATIVAPDCLTADALATACMVMGLDQSLKLVESLSDTEGLFICADSGKGLSTHYTKGMKLFLYNK